MRPVSQLSTASLLRSSQVIRKAIISYSKMVQIVGTYKHVSHAPNYESYLKNLGVPETAIPSIMKQKVTLTISENNGLWTFHYSDSGKEWSSTFKLGELYDEQMSNGDILKSVTKHEGDKLITESSVKDSHDKRVFEFTDAGITVHLSNPKSGISTSAVYKRV